MDKSYDELRITNGPLYSVAPPQHDDDNEPDTVGLAMDVSISDTSSSTPRRDQQDVGSIPNASHHIPLAAETTALLIVDVQPEYWSNCAAVRQDFAHFPTNLAQTIAVCRQRRAKIIWVRADYRYSHSPWLAQFERMRKGRNLGEVPCDPSSQEFRWEDFATPVGGEVIITKTSWSSTSNTALTDILRVAGIDTVLVCGLITSVCVQHSAFGLFEAGYRTLLVTDSCADRGRARHEAALALYGDYMYELVTSQDLESEETGLVPAKPIWLSMNHNRTAAGSAAGANSGAKAVVAQSFPSPFDGGVGARLTPTSSMSTLPPFGLEGNQDQESQHPASPSPTLLSETAQSPE